MAEQLQPLFNQLSTRLKAGDHSAAVQVCDQILAAAPGDADALHAKMVSLIELSRVEDALLLADSSPPLTDIVRFERAYCLYQLHREQESLALLMPAGVAPSEVREMQLAAQIFYRLGEYGQAADLFRQAEATGGPSAELSTNILAALVLAGRSADGVEYAKTTAGADEPGDKPHELVYNYACAAIEQGQMRTAKQLLQKAIELCRRTMAEGEDWSEEEVEVELGVLTAQSAYVDQCLGDLPAAQKAYQTLFAFKGDLDPAVLAVAANNMLRIRGQRDLFDSWKKNKANLSDTLAKKLTPPQRKAFLTNTALLALHMNKADQCKEILPTLEREFASSVTPELIRAALLQRAKQPKQCYEALEAAVAAAPAEGKKADAALLTLAQLQLQDHDLAKAIGTLKRAEGLATCPGMVGTLVALHERLGQTAEAAGCFEGVTSAPLLRAAAAFFSRHSMWPQAAAAQQRLLDADSRDLQALAGLVIATSHFDPALANEQYARLERGGAAEGEEEGSRRKKPRRKKRPLYPKGFDPENPSAFPKPDPERWLPKRERSTYRQRKKDKRAGISRGPQGSATGAATVDARATTNIQFMSEEQKEKLK
ncbi:signal recognition particle 72 kda protein, partial [Chrysochromulina tobinii]